ncbi:MAG: helix-turn-helix domain-containing protein [Lachnospiraceae bacterium]|nr:helix-turn-helix domain-containing protein [Lachnospiraceae bacterium]
MVQIFSNIIRKILKDCEDAGKKVTQVELAKVLGTTRQSFSNKMSRDTFTVDDLVKIANYLNMQVILKGEKEYVIKKED